MISPAARASARAAVLAEGPMPNLPWDEVQDALLKLALPAFGAALAAALLVRLLGRERLAPLASALAVAAGCLAANYFREAAPYLPEGDGPPTASSALAAVSVSLERPAPREPAEGEEGGEAEEPPAPQAARFWLPWLALLALLIDLGARLAPRWEGLGWSLRGLLAACAGRLLVWDVLRPEAPWAPLALAAAILALWGTGYCLSREWKDGSAALAFAVACLAAGVVALHAHSARLADLALMLAFPGAAVALVALFLPGDYGPLGGACAVCLPGLMLITQQEATDCNIPWHAFLMAGLSPLPLAVLVPWAENTPGWRRPALAVALVSLAVVAVALAVLHQPLDF